MDNSKKNVHNSGPLGLLIQSGQVRKLGEENLTTDQLLSGGLKTTKNSNNNYITDAGIEFSEQQLLLLDPKKCEPWEYANRQEDEFGDFESFQNSIDKDGQQQPGLVRVHPSPHDGIEYQIIFGRSRHKACLNLGKPFMVRQAWREAP